MLDTNIVSSVMRAPKGPAAERARVAGEGACCVSIISAAELRFGATRVASPTLRRQIDIAFALFPVVPFELPADVIYGGIRADLQRRGSPIGPTDLFIAAHALSLDLTLVTANVREFSRVFGLRVENWLD